ncbi:hypothetical protein LIER_33792 [Lithospermum erythrorhizon]|uniref:Uncharacterized protein n=1 Tax=Lithospermum erythrorhizon TaxID=34254 RepID=A0AAV3RYK0_LITER
MLMLVDNWKRFVSQVFCSEFNCFLHLRDLRSEKSFYLFLQFFRNLIIGLHHSVFVFASETGLEQITFCMVIFLVLCCCFALVFAWTYQAV